MYGPNQQNQNRIISVINASKLKRHLCFLKVFKAGDDRNSAMEVLPGLKFPQLAALLSGSRCLVALHPLDGGVLQVFPTELFHLSGSLLQVAKYSTLFRFLWKDRFL